MDKFTLALLALALAGCSGPQPIMLQDQQTKAVAECKADPWLVWSWDIPRYNEDCARKYEAAGYRRLK